MRALWFLGGAAAGVYVAVKARRTAEALTVEGIQDRLSGWYAGARVVREELLTGMAEKETELRARVAALPAGPAAIENGSRENGSRRDGTPRTLVPEAALEQRPDPSQDPDTQEGEG